MINLNELYPSDYLQKAEFKEKERKKLAHEGEAESDGSYPIRDEADLKNAIQAVGRSKNIDKTKSWIKKRAKELGKESMLPDKWKAEENELNKDMITLQDYKETKDGNNPYLVKGFIDNEIPTEDQFRKALDDKLEKGFITENLHTKAIEQLNSLMKAKKGEGSKGGHVIGHTKSGKPVYKQVEGYKDYSANEHEDASRVHHEKAYEHKKLRDEANHPSKHAYHKAMAQHHEEASKEHWDLAAEKHKEKATPDEKKILAEQKKKQIERHKKAHEYHSAEQVKLSAEQKKHEGKEVPIHVVNSYVYHRGEADHHLNELRHLDPDNYGHK